jgi:hypothetical protein
MFFYSGWSGLLPVADFTCYVDCQPFEDKLSLSYGIRKRLLSQPAIRGPCHMILIRLLAQWIAASYET